MRLKKQPRAFTLIELAVVNVVLVAGVAVLGPVTSHGRGAARNIESMRNLLFFHGSVRRQPTRATNPGRESR